MSHRFPMKATARKWPGERGAGRTSEVIYIHLQNEARSKAMTKRGVTAYLLWLGVWLWMPGSGDAQERGGAREVESSLSPGQPARVLQSSRVELGDRAIIYQRLAPPAPTPAPAARPGFVPPAERSGKPEKYFRLSATVYDRRLTKLRWFVGGREYHALSNVDFNYLAGIGTFETTDTIYSLVMGLGNESSEIDAALNRLAAQQGLAPFATDPAPQESFDPARAEYRLLGERAAAAPPEALAPLAALHRYFETHRARLIRDYEERVSNHRAREQWLKEHPPAPQDTTIRFWPKRGTFYFPAQP